MCGIFGWHAPAADGFAEAAVRRVRGSMASRGPDAHGWLVLDGNRVAQGSEIPGHLQGELLLTHHRLSILDLSEAGRQPMSTPDGRYHIVLNGEIYNYRDLRRELEREGWNFRSQTDTEVLLAAYAAWGRQALTRVVGMFAFALLDVATRRLLVARDRFGIKPLYYTMAPGGFAFASEIKALLAVPGVRRTANAQRVHDYLRMGLLDHDDETFFRDIRQLSAGHYLEVALDEPGTPQPVRYWDAQIGARAQLSFAEAAARLRELFLESVQLHMQSDVPVGAALSGGVDSSSVVSAMRHLDPRFELHVFSYTADDPRLSEERWIDVVGGATRAVVHKVHATADELVTDLDDLIRAQDEPFGSTSIYAQYCIFRRAHQEGIKVMLDGQGADELLAGYSYYYVPRLEALLRRGRWIQAARLVRALESFPGVPAGRILRSACSGVAPDLVHRVRGTPQAAAAPAWLNLHWFGAQGVEHTLPRRRHDRRSLGEQLWTALGRGLPPLLRYADRNSMRHSVESRVPFLTSELAEFVLSLPDEYLIGRDGTTKSVFRAAMRGIVPDAILDRRDKIGFETPEQRWLATLRPWVDEVLAGATAEAIPALELPAVRAEWDAVLQGRQPFDFRVWRWINLIRWAELYAVSFE
jgi:asparagine synthase (glutamine-hydrolysing)